MGDHGQLCQRYLLPGAGEAPVAAVSIQVAVGEEGSLGLQAPGSGWKEVSTGCVKQWGPEHFEAERRK